MRAKTYALDDIITVVMRGSGFTALEQTIMDSGEPHRVVDMRHEFQGWMAKRYTEAIEELTGRKVVAFLGQAHVEPDITMEIFFMDEPLKGFAAVEIIGSLSSCGCHGLVPAERSVAGLRPGEIRRLQPRRPRVRTDRHLGLGGRR
jgi:uncharacterized protein YbcI